MASDIWQQNILFNGVDNKVVSQLASKLALSHLHSSSLMSSSLMVVVRMVPFARFKDVVGLMHHHIEIRVSHELYQVEEVYNWNCGKGNMHKGIHWGIMKAISATLHPVIQTISSYLTLSILLDIMNTTKCFMYNELSPRVRTRFDATSQIKYICVLTF